MNMTYRKNRLAIAVGAIISSLSAVAIATPASVEIDLSKQQYIGNVSELDRSKFFNLHTSPTSSELAEVDVLYMTEELNAGFGRSFWGPMSVSGGTNYPSTAQSVQNGAVNVANAKLSPLYPYSSTRVVATEHPYQVIKEGNDPVEGARWAADYFENYYDDTNRPMFYEPMNEPFVHAGDFVEGPYDDSKNQVMREYMATWFAEIGREFDERELETKVVGYSAAWPSFELWDFGHWESRQKMFMDVAGEHMDAFSFHLYDGVNIEGQDNERSGSNAEAIIDLIETYSHIKWGEVKPHAVTEYGGIIKGYPIEYSPEKSSQELRSYNHILFSLLSKEDRILTSVPFITGSARWFYEANDFSPYSAVLLRPDPANIVAGKVLNLIPTEKAKFFQLWSEVKGHRVAVENNDADLGAQVFVYGNKVYVALNNFDELSKEVDIDFIDGLSDLNNVRIKRLQVPYGEAAIYMDTVAEVAPSSLTMAAHETAIIEYDLVAPVVHDEVVRQTSYYSQNYMMPIVENTEMLFEFDNVHAYQADVSFADVMSEHIAFDQAKVDEINERNQRFQQLVSKRFNDKWQSAVSMRVNPNFSPRLTPSNSPIVFGGKHAKSFGDHIHKRILKNFERAFDRIVERDPNGWKSSEALTKLVDRALKIKGVESALQLHYSEHGYNDMQGDANLRMSIGRKHDKSKQPLLVVNGHVIDVPNEWKGYDQAIRDDFMGTIEIPVPAKFFKSENDVSLTFADSDGHVSSVIVELDSLEEMSNVAVQGIDITASEMTINKDKMRRLTANVMPMNASDKFVTWSSSAPDIASVDQNGIVTPHYAGGVTITATTHDGEFTDYIDITVDDAMTVRNTVVINSEIREYDSTNFLSFDVDYVTDADREVIIEFLAPSKQVLASEINVVYKGQGTLNIDFELASALAGGEGYTVRSSMRKVGGDWRTTVDSHTIKNITVIEDTPPVVDETNLLGAINSGFEYGDTTDWTYGWDTTGTANVTAEAAFDGDYGLLVDTTEGRVGIVLNEYVFPQGIVKAGKTFKLSYRVKRVSGSGWAGGFAHMWNNANGWVATPQGPWFGYENNNDWHLIEKEIDGVEWADSGTNLQINFQTPGSTWYVDSVRLEDITPDGNLLADVNADFDTGSVEPWAPYYENDGSTSLTAADYAGFEGGNGMHITSSGDNNTGINLAPELTPQDLGIEQGKQYKISFDVKSNNVNGSGWMRNVAQGSWDTRIESWFAITTDWQRVEIIRDDVDRSGVANLSRFDLYINKNSGVGIDVFIDNIRIEEVIE